MRREPRLPACRELWIDVEARPALWNHRRDEEGGEGGEGGEEGPPSTARHDATERGDIALGRSGLRVVAQGGLEPPTPQFSVECSTN